MSNIIDYVRKSTASMKDEKLNDVDSLVLSCLSYLTYDCIYDGFYLKNLQNEEYLKEFSLESKENIELVKAVSKSSRFQNIQIYHYRVESRKEEEMQFAAVTFLLETGDIYVSYRGTDGSIVGWREDFNMAYMYPVPSQIAALSYLESVSLLHPGNIYVGGHSKGGNLSVYASCLANDLVKKRIVYVFSHDGPGFEKEFLKDCYFKTIKHKLRKTVPESSLIGMLLYSQGHYTIVKSDRFFIMEHDPFSWQVDDDHFVEVEHLSDGSIYTNEVICEWIKSLTKEERERFVDSLFSIIEASGVKTFHDLARVWQKKLPLMIEKLNDLSLKEKYYLWEVVKSLIVIAIKRIPDVL